MKNYLVLLFAVLLTASLPAADEKFFVAGESFTVFVSKVDGTPPFTYQWRKDGVDIPGATGAEYMVKAAAASDAGVYSVRIANKAGDTVSDNAAANIIIRASGAVVGFKTPASAPAAK